jgi:hypothetical protein
MSNTRPLKDEVYGSELDRMRMLARFPEVPVARQEMMRAMRMITRDNRTFLHEIISFFVDNGERCPTPHELNERAGLMRNAAKPLASPSCLQCGGAGWVHGSKMVRVAGMPPYEAEYTARCACVTARKVTA